MHDNRRNRNLEPPIGTASAVVLIRHLSSETIEQNIQVFVIRNKGNFVNRNVPYEQISGLNAIRMQFVELGDRNIPPPVL